MDPVLLARIQFAFTVGFHYIFPPLTIGMAWLIFWLMTRYKNTGEEFYKGVARFWLKLFAITFAVGVATGLTMEFQFGTNWAQYSRFVGDIFGPALAAEGILAFFLESAFMGVLIFGWDRLRPATMWFASLMVAVGSTMSALWILIANSWMQTPAGHEIVNGKVVLISFWAAVFNPSFLPRFTHTVTSCLLTGAFFMMGISAWYLLKNKHVAFSRESLRIGLLMAFVTSIAVILFGHSHAVQVTETQPEKLAAIEGLFETQRAAPVLLFGIPDYEEEVVHYEIQIPGLLSLFAYDDWNAEIKGLKDFPKEHWPPLILTFYPFHLMVGLGSAFFMLAAWGMYLKWKNKLFTNPWFLRAAVLFTPLPIVAGELGWITAEVGRQPWIVYKVMKTADAISPAVSSGELIFSLFLFGSIYSLLFFAWIYLLRREIGHGPAVSDTNSNGEVY